MVFDPIQKYKFESKSQLPFAISVLTPRCLTQYKNTNLKANHNKHDMIMLAVFGV